MAQGLAKGINTRTGRPVLDDMMAAAAQESDPGKNGENDHELIHVSSLDPHEGRDGSQHQLL